MLFAEAQFLEVVGLRSYSSCHSGTTLTFRGHSYSFSYCPSNFKVSKGKSLMLNSSHALTSFPTMPPFFPRKNLVSFKASANQILPTKRSVPFLNVNCAISKKTNNGNDSHHIHNPMDYTKCVDWDRNLGDHLRILLITGLYFEKLMEPVTEWRQQPLGRKR